ncbi:hypothetical protein [Polaromonas sp. LjRoot131]|uniref:hypothetical protein n=1 Tax=Polaromonas sp. LjRoot131 TaxID=3342262 RepID=UPI003ED068F8
MTPQQLVGLGVRLFAIWLGIASVAYWVSIPAALAANNLGKTPGIVSYAIGVAYVAAALLFWFFPMAIAHKLLPRTHYQNSLSAEPHELAKVGSALLGLWLITKAAPTLVWLIFRSFLFMESSAAFSSITPDAKLDISVALFELLLAIVLIVKAGAFAHRMVPVAESPREDPEDQEPSETPR